MKVVESLKYTQAYCNQPVSGHLPPLRTINPVYKGKPLFLFNDQKNGDTKYYSTSWSCDPLVRENEAVLESAFTYQHKLKMELPLNISNQHKGNILAIDIDYSIPDGVSAVASLGFIDEIDIPPIDTWLYVINETNTRILLSWVPEAYIPLAQRAIDVNALNNIYWFKDGYPEIWQNIIT